MWAGPCGFDQGDECLVTDITQELSAGLEGSPLLEDSLFDYEDVKPDCRCSLTFDSINERINLAVSDQVAIREEPFKTELSSGSGSETSSVELGWGARTDLDTPPTTPPLGYASENVCIVPGSRASIAPYLNDNVKTGRVKAKVKSIAAKDLNFINKNEEKIQNLVSLPKLSLSKDELQKQQAQRRKERMIRNRESAYLSRKRAKEHVSLLENQVQALTEDNHRLKEENLDLRARLSKYEPDSRPMVWRRKKTTVLLIIAVTFCINFNSFSLLDKRVNRDDVSITADPVSHHTRSLLWMQSLDENSLSNLSCPVAINQSESMRLERELREWIVAGGESHPLPSRVFSPQPQGNSSGRRKRIPRLRRARSFPLDVWGLKPSMLGLEGLYEAIHRRDDTFYLVSFSADHLLLPAMASNATTRPKMSFMLPAFLANASTGGAGQVEMMQIDCEVTNTQLLSVRDHDIPTRLRNARNFGNDSVKSTDSAPKEFPAYPLQEENYLINIDNVAQGFQVLPKSATNNTAKKIIPKMKNLNGSAEMLQKHSSKLHDILPTKPPMFWLKLSPNSTQEPTWERSNLGN